MNATILLVDDEASVLSALSRALFDEPYHAGYWGAKQLAEAGSADRTSGRWSVGRISGFVRRKRRGMGPCQVCIRVFLDCFALGALGGRSGRRSFGAGSGLVGLA